MLERGPQRGLKTCESYSWFCWIATSQSDLGWNLETSDSWERLVIDTHGSCPPNPCESEISAFGDGQKFTQLFCLIASVFTFKQWLRHGDNWSRIDLVKGPIPMTGRKSTKRMASVRARLHNWKKFLIKEWYKQERVCRKSDGSYEKV